MQSSEGLIQDLVIPVLYLECPLRGNQEPGLLQDLLLLVLRHELP